MKRVRKYFYNTETHKFEKLELSWQKQVLRWTGLACATIVTSIIIVAIAFRFLDSPKEKQMRAEINKMHDAYAQLQTEVIQTDRSLMELEKRDDNVYRAIFESAPLPDSVRRGKRYSEADPQLLDYIPTQDLITHLEDRIGNLRKRIAVQKKSYDTLEQMVTAKEKMLQCIPAIQPISNKSLEKLASGFGYRIDPIYKTPKMHTGLDFAAASGTPIYATADGTVAETGYDGGGYGNHVIINHGFGYKTLYGHMVRIKAGIGQRVSRGEVIGWVGSTGKSTGPHCHYEVIRNGEKINPVHFFFNDLSATDYDRMVRIAAAGNQSFD
ncbi:MAG: M23 family metallopeptidase [Sphingobacteriales bacterium]|nr:MAG: M23 family metallopeptidase [Sphingobacteriales bacterium]